MPRLAAVLKNLRQRIVQYCIKIEPCHAKVFRPTMVQRHIRDRANADSAVCTPKHQTILYMSAQSPSPWTFLTNLRQRIVQNYTKIEPGYAKVFRPTMVQRHIREWPDSGLTVARQRPTGPDTSTVRAQGHRSCGQTRPTPPTPLDAPTLDTPTRSDTTHASPCPTTLRHRSDTGQTPPTPSTPVSIDTAPTLLRHSALTLKLPVRRRDPR